jgi:chemotaxis protein methyltransferase CheR
VENYLEPEGRQLRYVENLRSHVVFAQHNLATDGSFNEFHLVVVRHVLAKFNRVLVYHAHQVIYESLVRLGFLALGAKESLRFTPHQKAYGAVPQTLDFYRRIR